MKVAYATVFDNATYDGAGITSITKEGTGSFMVNYDPFNGSPGVSATPWGTRALCSVNIMAENVTQVIVTDLKGNPIDSGFSFIAVGN